MLNVKTALFAAVIAVGSMSSAAMADSTPRYVQKRIPVGPRNEYFVLVPVDQGTKVDRPYALTGEPRRSEWSHRSPSRPVPSHVKGTHGPF